MLALVTNDDGIDAAGIKCLAHAAVDAGFDVLVAAPFENSSGGSCSLIAVEEHGRVVVRARPDLELPTAHAYAVAAMPGLITLMALQGAFGPVPDVVLSGVNDGLNTGRAVIHSGTVGAAFTAVAHGRPGMAVSMASSEDPHWATVSSITTEVLRWFRDCHEVRTMSLNIPDLPEREVRGVLPARLAAFGAVQASVVESGEGSVAITYEEVEHDPEPGTDAALLAEGFATITALEPISEEVPRDLASLLARFPVRPAHARA